MDEALCKRTGVVADVPGVSALKATLVAVRIREGNGGEVGKRSQVAANGKVFHDPFSGFEAQEVRLATELQLVVFILRQVLDLDLARAGSEGPDAHANGVTGSDGEVVDGDNGH